MSEQESRRTHVREHRARDKSAWARRIETEFKVPVDSLWPRYSWLACVVADNVYDSEQATDAEVRQIASYIDFMLGPGFYDNGGFARNVRELDLPLCSGHNTLALVKTTGGGWGYRRTTWHTGSWPQAYRGQKGVPQEPLTLLDILDHVNAHGPFRERENAKWETWKRQHSDVFPVSVSA